VVTEAARVLKPGGWLYATTPIPGTWAARADVTHINVRPKESWLELFRSVGFKPASSLKLMMKLSMRESFEAIGSTPSMTGLGRLLGKLALPGRWVRGLLKFVGLCTIYRCYYFILRLSRGSPGGEE
jgi:SAM-dependent methyltransferase